MSTWNWKLIVSCIVAFALWKAFFYWDNQRHRTPDPIRPPAISEPASVLPATAIEPPAADPNRFSVIERGFLTGNAFNAYPRDDKVMYVMGVFDGFLVSPALGAPKNEVAWFERCTVGMQPGQALAIVEKWLAENPQRWHESMHTSTFAAMRQSCPKRP